MRDAIHAARLGDPVTERGQDGETMRVARMQGEYALVLAALMTGLWVYLVVDRGWIFGLECSFVLALAGFMLGFAVLPRLRFSASVIELAIGPWCRRSELSDLMEVRWKRSGTYGIVHVRDRAGHHVPVYVGMTKRSQEWRGVLLDAVSRSGASIDEPSRSILMAAAGREGSPPEHE